jgi:hypothetical protein
MARLRQLPWRLVGSWISWVGLAAVALPLSAQPTLTTASRLAVNGIGPIRVGMTVAEAQQVGGVRLVTIYGDASCAMVSPQGEPEDLRFIVTNGRIATVETFNPLIQTVSGANVGDTVNEVLALYPGRLEVRPSESVPNGQDLVFVPWDADDQDYRVYFITENNQVIKIRAGRLPEVGWYEGCL